MGDAGEKKISTISLQSKDHEELLNIIDKLRSQGISRYIDLPQLIVCGDQSAGKSSVLEAVSGLRFPTKDNLCTRFATELVLRRSAQKSITVTILPEASRSELEKQTLAAFKTNANVFEEFGTVLALAGKAMGLDQNGKVFSSDVLRVEVCGPGQPHLTLVDLPGLFHAGNKTQSEKDAASVKALVTTYMKKSRSIILAVVSAKNDYANQIVTKYARDFDPNGDRTLGIITKPDTLHAGSDSERQFFELAENKDVSFRLGWHVLKNRDYSSRDCTDEERDLAEETFFSKGIWTSLSPTQVGIRSLKPRLSRVLTDQILIELPSLIRDVESGIKDCKGRLDRLGGERASPLQQRAYLHKVSNDFTELVRAAVKGHYDHDFFGDVVADVGGSKRLRAVVVNKLLDFSNDMRTRGHYYQTVESIPLTSITKAPPFRVSRQNRIEKIRILMRNDRGTELPGTYKPDIIGTLFREQSTPWKNLITECAASLFEAARHTVLLILDFTADQATKNGILRFVINPALEKIKQSVEDMVYHTLKHHQSSHPITLNHYLTDNIQKSREEHNRKHLASKLQSFFGVHPLSENPVAGSRDVNTKALLDSLVVATEADMSTFACSEALACMEAYYKVALKYVTDDFAIHTIEECLMQKLEGVFTTFTVMGLPESVIEDIAAETEESQRERASSTQKKEALEDSLSILHHLDRHRPITDATSAQPVGSS